MVFGKLVGGSEKNEQMQQVTAIRDAVLVQELQLSIQEEPDAFCMYALVYEGETAVATGGISYDGESCQMKEVAVLPAFRGKKYGDFIVRLLIDKAMMSGAQMIDADVLQEVVQIFETVGFQAAGELYEKDGKRWFPMQLQTKNVHKCCKDR